MMPAAPVFAVIAGVFASLVLLDLVSILVFAPNMGVGTGEIVWRVALVLAGALFSASDWPGAGRADRRAGADRRVR